jgi:hypothetical protein
MSAHPGVERRGTERWWPSEFGQDDQLGMLNHIDEAKRREALGLVRQGRLYDLPAEDPDRPFEVPQRLNVHHGVFIVENLDTSQLAADGVREFALILTHPKLRGATGAWTSPIALV